MTSVAAVMPDSYTSADGSGTKMNSEFASKVIAALSGPSNVPLLGGAFVKLEFRAAEHLIIWHFDFSVRFDRARLLVQGFIDVALEPLLKGGHWKPTFSAARVGESSRGHRLSVNALPAHSVTITGWGKAEAEAK